MSGDGSDGAKIALCALRGMTGIPVCATPIPAGAMAGSGTELRGKEEGGGAAVRDSFIIRSQGGSGWSRGGGWTRGSVRDCSAPALGVRNSGRRRRVGFGLRRPFSGGLARASSSLGAADGEGESRFRGRPVVAEVGGAGALLVRSGGWRRRVVLGSAAVLFQCGAGFGSAAALSGRCGRSPRSPRSEQRAEAGGGTQTHRGVVDA